MPVEIDIYKNATRVGRAQGIDFKEGQGLALTIAKDIGNSQVDVTAGTTDGLMMTGLGLKGWNANPLLITNNLAPSAQQVRFTLMPLRAGDVVTNLWWMCSTISQSVTTTKVGLYDTAGTQLGVSANDAAANGTVGYRSLALTTPYTVVTAGVYYAAIMIDASTMGNIGGFTATTSKGGAGLTYRISGIQASQADLPSPTATISGSDGGVWFGWS